MAQISMGTLYGYASGSNYGRYSCVLYYDSVTRNGLTVTVNNARVVMTRYNSGYTTNRIAGRAGIGGSQTNIASNTTLSKSGKASPASITFSLGSPSVNTTGTSFAFYVAVASTGASKNWGNFIGNSPLVLSTSIGCVGAYTTVSQSYNSKTETSITMNWSATDTCDYLWYSTNNGGSWTAVGGINASSGTYTISGLSANTTYNIKTRVRRKDSQLTSDYGSYNAIATYNYPYITSAPDFIIGNSNTISFYNPLSRNCAIYLTLANNQQYGGDSTTGTSISGYNSTGWQNNLYNSIPNAKSGVYKVRLVCSALGRDTTVNGGTYSCNEAVCKPTFTTSNVAYYDNKSSVTNITQNNQKIVQNQSELVVNFTGGSCNKGSSLASYKAVVNNVTKTRTTVGTVSFGTVNSSQDLTLTATMTDSRGFSTSVTKKITMVEWSLPTAEIYLNRLNNWEDTTYLKVNGACSYVLGKNSFTIQYQYKKITDTNYCALKTLSSNVQETVSCLKEHIWDFKIIIKDKFGTTTYNLQLPKGVPILYIDSLNLGVGVNCFPAGTGLYVNGNKIG